MTFISQIATLLFSDLSFTYLQRDADDTRILQFNGSMHYGINTLQKSIVVRGLTVIINVVAEDNNQAFKSHNNTCHFTLI